MISILGRACNVADSGLFGPLSGAKASSRLGEAWLGLARQDAAWLGPGMARQGLLVQRSGLQIERSAIRCESIIMSAHVSARQGTAGPGRAQHDEGCFSYSTARILK